MQAKAIVMNPCFYKGFFSSTDNLWLVNIFLLPFTQNHGFEYVKKLVSELINFTNGAIMILLNIYFYINENE
jgi:hypothetical protein